MYFGKLFASVSHAILLNREEMWTVARRITLLKLNSLKAAVLPQKDENKLSLRSAWKECSQVPCVAPPDFLSQCRPGQHTLLPATACGSRPRALPLGEAHPSLGIWSFCWDLLTQTSHKAVLNLQPLRGQTWYCLSQCPSHKPRH